jgi:CheY-like chemotaxis protein
MKKKVLVTDSSKAIRFLIQTVFEKKFEVITAQDAGSAMYWLSRKLNPDLIILDPQLPDVENWEMISQIKSGTLYKNIPILVITSLPKGEVIKKCAEYGVVRFFYKPFDPLLLLESAESIFELTGAELINSN